MSGYDTEYQTIPITFERGLLESVEDSMLPPGSASRLINMEPDTSGNLRVRPGWSKASVTSAPSTRKGMGIGHLAFANTPYVRQFVSTDSSGNPADFSKATLTGSTLVACVFVDEAGSSPTPPGGEGYSSAVTSSNINGALDCRIFLAQNASSRTVNGTWGSATFRHIAILEVVNVEASSLDQTASATSGATSDTTVDSGTTATTVQNVEFCVAALMADGVRTFSAPTNGFEIFLQDNNNGADTAGVFTKSQTLKETQQCQATIDVADTDVGVIVTLKASSASDQTSGRFYVANNEGASTIKVYSLDRDDLAAGTWTLEDTISEPIGSVPVAFTAGLDQLFYTHPNFDNVRHLSRDAAPAYITGAPAGRCIAFHKERLFVGGVMGSNSLLYFSEIGDYTIWSGVDTTAGSIPVGEGDGESIEDITPFEDGLLIGKQTSLWFLAGSGPDNFRLTRLKAGSAAPGRSILMTPYGAVVAGDRSVWIVSQGAVDLISRGIVDSYGRTGNWLTVSYMQDYDTAYISDEGTGRVFAINFAKATWHLEEIQNPSTEGVACLYNQNDTQLFAPKNATTGSLLSYRMMPPTTRTKDFDTLTEAFTYETPEMWVVGPEEKVTPRYLFVKFRQRGGTANQTGVSLTIEYDGSDGETLVFDPFPTAGVHWYRKTLGNTRGISAVKFKFSQTIPSAQASLMEPEEITFGYIPRVT